MTQKIIFAIIEIFGLFSVGAFARKFGYIKEEEINRWTRLVLDIFLPLFTFSAVLNGIDRSRIGELWVWPVVGLGQVLFAVGVGLLLQYGLRGKYVLKRPTFLHFCAFNNFTYLPIIIFRNLWGESSLSMLFLMGVGTSIGVWTVGVAVLNISNMRSAVKSMVTPNLAAIILALILACTAGKEVVPPLVMRVFMSAGSIAAPLIIILIGSSLVKKSTFVLSWPVMYITVVRLIVLPLLSIKILKMLPLSRELYESATIIALMPVALVTVLMTKRFGGFPEYAASSALITTLLSMITVPLAVWLFL